MPSGNPLPVRSSAGPGAAWSTGQLAMVLALVSISVLFVASCIAVLVTRAQAPAALARIHHALPWGVAASTAFLAGLSACLHIAVTAIRHNAFSRCQRHLLLAGVCALAFLAGQLLNCRQVLASEAELPQRSVFAVAFFLLIGVHALHVAGGLFPLAYVYARARRQEYSSSRYEGLRLCAQYWHYLGVVWLLLLLTLALVP
jgi:cytochrome c oxidase subunit III